MFETGVETSQRDLPAQRPASLTAHVLRPAVCLQPCKQRKLRKGLFLHDFRDSRWTSVL